MKNQNSPWKRPLNGHRILSPGKILPAAILFFALGVLSCYHTDTSTCENKLCDLALRSVAVTIKNQDGNAVVLDSLNTTLRKDNTVQVHHYNPSHWQLDILQQTGVYPVVWDHDLTSFDRNSPVEVQFTAYLNGMEVVKENLIVLHDCCHASLVSGETNLILPF